MGTHCSRNRGIFLRRRSPPAFTKLLLVGPHDIYGADPLAGAESCALVWYEPGAAGWFAGLPAKAMRNVITPIEVVWGEAGRRLHERCAACCDEAAAAEVLRLALLERPRSGWDRTGRDLIRRAEHLKDLRDVDDMAALAGYSVRQLRRLFDQDVGMNPKLVLRLLRVRRTLAALRRDDTPDWVTLAQAAGYADQAHLVNEVRWFTGLTPSQIASSRMRGMFIDHEVILVPKMALSGIPFAKPRGSMADQPRMAGFSKTVR